MSWTEFTVVMDDGERFPFGTAFRTEFFEMPNGYSVQRIQKIVPHKIGKPQVHPASASVRVYRERPYFTCYIDGL